MIRNGTYAEEGSTKDITSNKFGLHKYCLSNPWKDGLAKMIKDNHIEVTANKNARKDRKRSVAKFIVQTVRDDRINNGTVIGKKIPNVSPATWCDTVHELDVNYYR